jgi:hypothetical protein
MKDEDVVDDNEEDGGKDNSDSDDIDSVIPEVPPPIPYRVLGVGPRELHKVSKKKQ